MKLPQNSLFKFTKPHLEAHTQLLDAGHGKKAKSGQRKGGSQLDRPMGQQRNVEVADQPLGPVSGPLTIFLGNDGAWENVVGASSSSGAARVQQSSAEGEGRLK